MISDRRIYSREELKNAAPLALSFVGDAVHTLFVRERVFGESPYKNGELHKLAGNVCCAPDQARKAKILMPLLTEEELFVFKKGKNAHVNSVPKHSSLTEYKLATALEAVAGYLFLSGQDERLNELMKAIYEEKDSETTISE